MPNGCNVFGPKDEVGVSCCNKHDRHYVKGDISKAKADLELYRCVRDAGHPIKASIMYAAVSTIGHAMWLKYRLRGKRNAE